MITLSELEVSTLCELELANGCRIKCIVVNPAEGRVVSLPDEEIDFNPPESKVTAIGEPMGSLIFWRAIDD
jgi:hypothetical protein